MYQPQEASSYHGTHSPLYPPPLWMDISENNNLQNKAIKAPSKLWLQIHKSRAFTSEDPPINTLTFTENKKKNARTEHAMRLELKLGLRIHKSLAFTSEDPPISTLTFTKKQKNAQTEHQHAMRLELNLEKHRSPCA